MENATELASRPLSLDSTVEMFMIISPTISKWKNRFVSSSKYVVRNWMYRSWLPSQYLLPSRERGPSLHKLGQDSATGHRTINVEEK